MSLSDVKINQWVTRFPWHKIIKRRPEKRVGIDYQAIRAEITVLQSILNKNEQDTDCITNPSWRARNDITERAINLKRVAERACSGIAVEPVYANKTEVQRMFATWIESFMVWRLSTLLSIPKSKLRGMHLVKSFVARQGTFITKTVDEYYDTFILLYFQVGDTGSVTLKRIILALEGQCVFMADCIKFGKTGKEKPRRLIP